MSENRAYLRAADIATLTGMSLRTVRRWIADGVIPSSKLAGARLVSKADLETVLSGLSDRPQERPSEGEESTLNHNASPYRESLPQEHVPSLL